MYPRLLRMRFRIDQVALGELSLLALQFFAVNITLCSDCVVLVIQCVFQKWYSPCWFMNCCRTTDNAMYRFCFTFVKIFLHVIQKSMKNEGMVFVMVL
jgi:hypothetical protein